MRFREGSMRSFRELSRGSKIHSKHPKRQWVPPPRSAPKHSGRTSASELERGPPPPVGRALHEQGQPGSKQRRKGGRYKESRPSGGGRGRKGAGRVRKGAREDEQARERGLQEDRKTES